MEERPTGLSVEQIIQTGATFEYTVQRQNGDSVVLTRPAVEKIGPAGYFPVVVEIFLCSGDAATYLPHPRQPAFRLFHFGAALAPETLSAVLRNPWNDLQFSYRLSEIISRPDDTVPTAPPPMTLTAALERQATVIEREIADLRTERAEIRRRLRGLHRPRLTGVGGEEDSDSALGASNRGTSDDAFLQTGYRKEVDSLSGRDARSRHSGTAGPNSHAFDGSKSETNRRQMSNAEDGCGRVGAFSRPRDRSGYNDDDAAGGDMSLSAGSVSRATSDRARGNKAVWSLFYPDTQEDFGKCWALKAVNLVALGRGYLISYDDGTVTWHDICPLLDTKLRQQGITPLNIQNKGPHTVGVRVKYLVLGEGTNFYVKFDNGRMEWCGNDTFGETLRKGVNERRLMVERVAFGQAGAWLVLWSDSTFDCEGLPVTLVDRLRRSSKREGGSVANGGGNNLSPRGPEGRLSGVASGIRDITVGPTGEWFIIYKDHSVQADNLPDGLYKHLSQIREKSGRVRSIIFGENRSWFVRYWDGPK